MARTGLQRSVLELYRKCLREIRRKPIVCPSVLQTDLELELSDSIGASDEFQEICTVRFCLYSSMMQEFMPVRDEFNMHMDIDKRDFATIELLVRRGTRQLETYSSPGIKNILV